MAALSSFQLVLSECFSPASRREDVCQRHFASAKCNSKQLWDCSTKLSKSMRGICFMGWVMIRQVLLAQRPSVVLEMRGQKPMDDHWRPAVARSDPPDGSICGRRPSLDMSVQARCLSEHWHVSSLDTTKHEEQKKLSHYRETILSNVHTLEMFPLPPSRRWLLWVFT